MLSHQWRVLTACWAIVIALLIGGCDGIGDSTSPNPTLVPGGAVSATASVSRTGTSGEIASGNSNELAPSPDNATAIATTEAVKTRVVSASIEGTFMADNRPHDIDFLSLTHAGYQIRGFLIIIESDGKGSTVPVAFPLEGTGDDAAITVTLYRSPRDENYTLSRSGTQLTLSFPLKSAIIGSRIMTPATQDEFSQLVMTWQSDLSRQFHPSPTPAMPYLGIAYDAFSPDHTAPGKITDEAGKPLTTGILVTEVVSGSPAERSGLQAGDVILTLNGITLDFDNTLPSFLLPHFLSPSTSFRPGDTVTLTVLRNRNHIQLQVTLGTKPACVATSDCRFR